MTFAAVLAALRTVSRSTYYDTGSGDITLATPAGVATTLANRSGTNTWKHAAAELTGADLSSSAGHELRLAGGSASTPSDITVSQIRVTVAGPSATLGPNQTDTGISPNAGDNPAGLITGTVGGRGYWQTNTAAPAPATNFFYMNVADSYAYNTSDIVLVARLASLAG